MLDLALLYLRAAELIEERGWEQHNYSAEAGQDWYALKLTDTCLCFYGAIGVAALEQSVQLTNILQPVYYDQRNNGTHSVISLNDYDSSASTITSHLRASAARLQDKS